MNVDENSDFVKGHPYENCSKSVIFESSDQISCIFMEYAVGNLKKKQFFLKITRLFFRNFSIDNRHMKKKMIQNR